jgi:SAM-dependent methyltransferase
MRGMKTTPQSLIYPLNVYAELLDLAFGQVDYLSYGFQARPELSVTDAQQAMAAKLMSLIDAEPGARVLDAGCGTGTLARQLARAGFQVTAIDINARLIDTAQQADADPAMVCVPEFVQADLQTYIADRPFDVIVLQNSARYLSPLTVFAQARRLLNTGGQLLVLEEFTGNTQEQSPEPLPVFGHVLQMADRAGFALLQQEDLSVGVADWLQRCLPLMDQYLTTLSQRTGLPLQQLRDLRQAMADDLDKCLRGRYRHDLLSFRMGSSDVSLLPADQLSPYDYRQLFERSFDTDFDVALWQWKYGDGRGHSVVACKDGEAVAHYGGVSRDIVYFGQPERALQICDVMVLPQHRSFYSRRSLFFMTAASMLELHTGNTAGHLLGFGFPNIKAMHVAERLGLYRRTDELLALSYPADGVSAAGAWSVSDSLIDDHTGGLIDRLWQQMASALADGIVGYRDAAYLAYRYDQRPNLDYRYLILSHPSGSHAFAVIREHGELSLIMDIIAAPADLPLVLMALCRHGHDSGRAMVFWLTAGQLPRLQSATLHTDVTGIHIPCNAWTRGPAADDLQGKWWLTAGDMDFL